MFLKSKIVNICCKLTWISFIFQKSIIIKRVINWSLQAQAKKVSCLQKRKRTSRFTSCTGSATIETSLALPVFLCALCSLIIIGQLILTEATIQYTVSKTATICAKQEAVRRSLDKQKNQITEEQKEDTIHRKASDFIGVRKTFYSVFPDSSICKNCIQGGNAGIILSSSKISEKDDTVYVCAAYGLKVPVPFFKGIVFYKKNAVAQRIFDGYVEHEGETEEIDRIVYLAENGTVYHTSLSCSHICLKITDQNKIEEVSLNKKYRACEKCIKKEESLSQLYLTAYGDCFHNSLSCSGLKRTLRAVKLSEVTGMRKCARCAVREDADRN